MFLYHDKIPANIVPILFAKMKSCISLREGKDRNEASSLLGTRRRSAVQQFQAASKGLPRSVLPQLGPAGAIIQIPTRG